MTLVVPESVTLPDGATAQVKRVVAAVIDGRLTRVVYTIEKANGAWADMECEEFTSPESSAASGDRGCRSTEDVTGNSAGESISTLALSCCWESQQPPR